MVIEAIYSIGTYIILVLICDDIMNVWVNKVISNLKSMNTSPLHFIPGLRFFF